MPLYNVLIKLQGGQTVYCKGGDWGEGGGGGWSLVYEGWILMNLTLSCGE